MATVPRGRSLSVAEAEHYLLQQAVVVSFTDPVMRASARVSRGEMATGARACLLQHPTLEQVSVGLDGVVALHGSRLLGQSAREQPVVGLCLLPHRRRGPLQ